MITQHSPAFIDFEASSLDLIASYPIEVGICLPDGTLHSWLIQPHILWQDWSESAEKIHGITRKTLEREGTPVYQVATALNRLLTGPVYCDAWTFDSFWLHRLFRAANMRAEFQLESVSMLLNADEVRLWANSRQRVINQLGLPVHRAANDALILHKTWEDIQLLAMEAAGPDQAR
ncbi:hypothetical protein QPM17_16340 [Marinobacter sp. TBZ242]|uniref:Exonuclease n=1 Tax=Marinobacter azerbaijanicus TaxID=3050455 RepID=A0ABT7IEW6_9GAMM|nr:hypothetical protein [Marinobacter sp. TBZ242]MDL0432712.1 hypothetical protein [Marinobacter sp. TBZ242]